MLLFLATIHHGEKRLIARNLTESFRAFDFGPLSLFTSLQKNGPSRTRAAPLNYYSDIEIPINHRVQFISNEDRWRITAERGKENELLAFRKRAGNKARA